MKSTREILEDAIAAEFDDIAAHSAYADLLTEQGDPRGEYVQLLLLSENPARPSSLREDAKRQAHTLLRRHEIDWVGALGSVLPTSKKGFLPDPESSNVEHRWQRGWVTAIDVIDVRDPILEVLAGAKEVRMLQELKLVNTRVNVVADLGRLVDSPYFTTLRSLELGDPLSWRCVADGNRVAPLIAKNPRLRRLILAAVNTDAGAIFATPLCDLRELRIDFAAAYPLSPLAENRSLGNLRSLWLDPRPQNLEAIPDDEEAPPAAESSTRDEVAALFASPHLSSVRTLVLRLTGIGDWAAHAAVRHGWLARLERFDLCQTGLTDEGALALAGCPELGRLKQLDVQGNRLTVLGINALREFDIKVHCRYQEGGFDDDGDDDGGFGGFGGMGTDIEVVDL